MTNYIQHHGIENQKWGVRHGPPYPLNPSSSSKIKSGVKKGVKVVSTNSKIFAKEATNSAKQRAKQAASQTFSNQVSNRIQNPTNPNNKKGKELVKTVLISMGAAAASAVAFKVTDKAFDIGEKALTAAFTLGKSKATDFMAKNGKKTIASWAMSQPSPF